MMLHYRKPIFVLLIGAIIQLKVHSSLAAIRLVIENCFDDVDSNKVSEFLDINAHPNSTIIPCGNISALTMATGSSGTLKVVSLITFGLAASLQSSSLISGTNSWTAYSPDRWLRQCTAVLTTTATTTTPFLTKPRQNGSLTVAEFQESVGVYLLNSTSILRPVVKQPVVDHNVHNMGSINNCGVQTWQTHLLSLVYHVNNSENIDGSPLTVYLYYRNGINPKMALNRGFTLGPEFEIGVGNFTNDRKLYEDFVIGGYRSIPPPPCREVEEHICVTRLSISKNFLRIGVLEFPPLMMWIRVPNGEITQSSGVLMDMIRVFASKLNFNYTLVEMDKYGQLLPNGTWIGAIGAVIRNEVDLVVADMSMSPVRAKVVDFSIPYVQGSQGVVIKRAMEPPSVGDLLRTHLRPFHWSIWLVLFATLLLSTAMLTRASSKESTLASRKTPPVTKPPVHRAVLHVQEPQETWWSIMFQMLGIFCQQGCGLSPTTTSGRVIFYTLCLTSLATYNFYTSVFISFTTVTKRPVPVNSLVDVLRDPTYKVGFIQGTRTHEMFQTSDSIMFRGAWRRMQSSNNYFAADTKEGVDRAYSENYAFIDEVTGLEFYIARNCSLKLLQDRLLNEGYHLVFPKGSNDTILFNLYLKKLHESGMFSRFLANHMPSMTSDYCADDNSLEAVGLDRMAGLFICLAIGISLTTISLWLEKLRPVVHHDRNELYNVDGHHQTTTKTPKKVTVVINKF